MARRPLTYDERAARVRVLAFTGAIVAIVLLVVGAVAVFGSFLARFGQA